MKIRQILGLLMMIVLVVAISGCTKKQPTVQQPTAPTAPSQPTPAGSETTPAAKEQLTNAKATSEGFCGDNVCQNVEHQYPNDKLVCVYQSCTVAGQYTENNYNCPGDCGTTCTEDTTIGVKPGSCKTLSNGDIEFTIVNSGYKTIDGFFFYVAEKSVSLEGQVGYDSSEKGLDSKQGDTNLEYSGALRTSGTYTVDISSWKEKFGNVDHIEIMPRVVADGQTKECSNQKNLLPLRNCQ